MSGSELPNTRGQSDVPRDTLVELVGASLFADYGLAPSITENEADLELSAEGLKAVVECKRPTALASALRRTRVQLLKRSNNGETVGIALLATECMANL